MNPYNFALLFFSFCTFFIGLFVYLKRNDIIGKTYFIFCILVTLWGGAWSVLISQNASYEAALFSSRFAHGSAVFVGVMWYQLGLLFSGRYETNKKLIAVLYVLAGIIDIFAFTPWFIPKVESKLGFVYYTHSGIVLDVANIIFVAEVLFGFSELAKAIARSNSKEEKTQLKGLFFATATGFLGGTSILLPIYGIMFPQYNLFLMPIYPFVMAYFMTRHKLFDIEQIVQSFQREKLATIGLIAASINHEIKNPLYAAQGVLENYLELTREGLKAKDPAETTEKALKQVKRALEVIAKLNRFAKPSVESRDKEKGLSANIHEAVQAALDLVSYEFKFDRISIDNQIGQGVPLVKADQRQLEEIFLNLIINACHAMPGGGELVIAAHRHCEDGQRMDRPKQSKVQRLLRSARNDGFVLITISDTGVGISREHLKHIFEPFYTTKGDKGTGLGLYITKQLVERNGGTISVKTQEGKGTSFILEFKNAAHD